MFGSKQKFTVSKSEGDHYGLSYLVIERPGYTKILNIQSDTTSEESFYYHTLFTFYHAFELHRNEKMKENEWSSWLQLIHSTFQNHLILSTWYKDTGLRTWFAPEFIDFIDHKIIPVADIPQQ